MNWVEALVEAPPSRRAEPEVEEACAHGGGFADAVLEDNVQHRDFSAALAIGDVLGVDNARRGEVTVPPSTSPSIDRRARIVRPSIRAVAAISSGYPGRSLRLTTRTAPLGNRVPRAPGCGAWTSSISCPSATGRECTRPSLSGPAWASPHGEASACAVYVSIVGFLAI